MALTHIESFVGAKNKHPTTRCICDCGQERIVRTTRLRCGLVNECGACAKKAAAKRGGATRRRLTDAERVASDHYSHYKQNAKKRGLVFDLPLDVFSSLTERECVYCGAGGRVGVDRENNGTGYTQANCVPCCSDCNYAKRDMSKESFLAMIARIYAHQSR